MLGYADLRESLIWVQCDGPASVQVEYQLNIDSVTRPIRTDAVITEKNTGYTAKIVVDNLEPGRQYSYKILLNGREVPQPAPLYFKTQPLWRWRTNAPDFTLATGSCAYVNETPYDRPGKPYGSEYQVFSRIHEQNPDLMLWLGDNVYFREPDWASRAGMIHRYTHDRAIPELRALLASTRHYAIWDDHDFGPNDSDRSWVHKETSWEIFKAFWGNPTFGVEGEKGCTTYFQYMDVDFFLLDNRYFRSANFCKTCPRSALGAHQLQWLKNALAGSQAPFKIIAVGGQFVTTSQDHETFAGMFPAERDSILRFIEQENIKGVVFLTGDKHFTELSALKNKAGNWVYDLTCSPLTSGVNSYGVKEKNDYRVDGTVVMEHNFALLRFTGPYKAREMEIRVIDAKGKEHWKRSIKEIEHSK
jgi:alkaline phosphatase D